LNAYSGSVNCTTDVYIGSGEGSNGLLNLRERAAFHHDTGSGNFTVGNIGTGIVTLGTDGATATTPALTNLRGTFTVGGSGGSGTVTAYAGTITTGGTDEIGVTNATLGQLNLYGNSTFNHQSTTANFTLGSGVAATMLIGRDGIATDNATLNLAGGMFRIGYASKTSTVSAYSGAINAHGGVLAGAYGGTANINLYGTAKFLHDTTGDFSFYNGTLTLGRSGNTIDNAALTLNTGAFYLANGSGASGKVIVNSGAVTGSGMTCLGMGYGTATSEWKQEGGTTNLGNCPVYLGGHSTAGGYSTNTLRLDGGVFAAAKFSPDPACTADELNNIVDKIYFNGGTLRATADSTTAGGFLAFGSLAHFNAYVQSRGAVIDTNSHDVLIASALSADPGSTGGGLMKLGAGKLTLSGTLGYTGNTTVNAGTLVAERGINTPLSAVYVATGAKLTAPSIMAGTLTIGGSPKPLPTASAVPEPGTMLLLLTALMVVAGGILRCRKT
jgi:autotransporter-associated beta strand protein